MIRFFNKKKDFNRLLELIKDHTVKRFYYTSDRERYIIKDVDSLRNFLFNCDLVIVSEKTRETFDGVLAIWKGLGQGVQRDYVKYNVLDEKILSKLLTYLFWYHNKEVFVKIKENSKFMNVFLEKGFHRIHLNDREFLLKRYNKTVVKVNAS